MKLNKYLLLSLFGILMMPTIIAQNFKADLFTAQDVDEMSTWELLKYDGRNAFNGIAYAYSRPFHWGRNDFYRLGGTLGVVGGLYLVDEDTSDFARRNKSGVPQVLQDFGWYFGAPQNNYGVTGAIYAFGLLTKSPEWRRTGVLMISSATAGGLLQQILKTVTGRARPQTGVGKDTFRPFSGESGYRSFPSGHTVLSFTTAYALAKHFDNKWVKAGIYSVGLISPVSRVWEGAHYLSDVVLSIALVVATVEGVDRFLDTREGYGDKRYNSKRKDRKVAWNVTATTRTVGLTLQF
jgi:membrane-associated phospholipid phosphatase